MDVVKIICGAQPNYFTFGSPGVVSPTTTATAASNPIPKDGVYSTYQAIVKGTGAVTATVTVYATNDPNTAGADQNSQSNAGPVLNFAIGTTNASTAVTQANGYFKSSMTGYKVVADGVPAGTTFTYVSPTSGTLSANATATASVAARFQDSNWVTLGTISLSGTTSASDGFATASSWKWVYANVSAISGTGATVSVIQGV